MNGEEWKITKCVPAFLILNSWLEAYVKTLAVQYKLDDPEDKFESVNVTESSVETETELDFAELPIKTLLSKL